MVDWDCKSVGEWLRQEGLGWPNLRRDNSRLIPFREGKLTRLFQNFFSGKGKAAMIVNVNQCASMFDETFHVFKFSAIAKQLVVVQKPEPKLKVPQPKCSARRSSIAWACPPHQEVQSKTSLAANVPLPCTSDDDLEESYSEVQELHEIIEALREQLLKERDSRMMDELRIREEVCKEMMQQIVKIESNYSERLREQEVIHEERLEKKIELLKSIHHTEKNPSQSDKFEDNDDEWVSSMLLHAEQVKVQERDEKVESLQAQVDKLNKQLAEKKSQNEKLQISLKDSSVQEDDASLNKQAVLETVTQQLEDARDKVKEKEVEIKELNETLTEAAETFMQKESEIKQLEEVLKGDEEKLKQQEETITDLQKLLDQSKAALEIANDKLTSRDIKILELRTDTEDLQGSCISNISVCSTSRKVIPESDLSTSQCSIGRRDMVEYFVKSPRGCEGDKVLRLVITPVKTTKLLPKQTKTSMLRMKGTPTKDDKSLKNMKGNKRKMNNSDACATPGSVKRQRMSTLKTSRVSLSKSKVTQLATRGRNMSGKTVNGKKYNLRTRR